MHDSYNQFSSLYREFIIASGHLQNEQKLLDHLLTKFKITQKSNIIDAACGTGDLLENLISKGYENVIGMDSSKGMLGRAKEILPEEILINGKWENLNEHPELLNKFDLVVILSVSLLHANQNDLPIIFLNLRNILKTGGVLIFDNRNWTFDNRIGLIEQNRIINQSRQLNTIFKKDKKYLISDSCNYKHERQFITYKMEELTNGEQVQELVVSYLTKTHQEFITLLDAAGFIKSGHKHFLEWPYEIIYSIK